MSSALVLVSVIFALLAPRAMADARKEFQVRPGVDGAVDLSDGALRCDFAWRGVAGGTGEVCMEQRVDDNAALVNE